MKRIISTVVVLVWGVALTMSAGAAQAQPERVYVEVVPVGPIAGQPEHPLAPEAIRQAIAGILTQNGYSSHPLGDDRPSNGLILRVMYIVNERGGSDDGAVAAAASTDLKHTASANDGTVTLSLYQGVQQSLLHHGPAAQTRESLRQAFVSELRERINQALDIYDQRYRGR